MAGKIKVSVIIFFILLLAAISFGAWAFLGLQTEKNQNIILQNNIDKLVQETKRIEARLQDTQKANIDLDAKYQDANKRINALSQEIEKERSAKQDFLSQSEQLRKDLEEQKNERANLEKKLESSQQEVKALTDQLNDLNTKKKELEDKSRALPANEQKVELGKIVVAPETLATGPAGQPAKAVAEGKAAAFPISSLETKVLVVNKDYNFVVLNAGSKDGIAIGDVFSLSHNNKPIGDVSVEKVHEAMAAAGFLNPETKDKVREGDSAILKSK